MSKLFIFNKISVHFTWVFILLLAITFSGCRILYRSILGVDMTPQWYSSEDIEKSADRYEMPFNQLYEMDTVSFSKALRIKYKGDLEPYKDKEETIDSLIISQIKSCAKDDGQIVHVRFFSSDGKPIFKLVNCYVDPPIPMSWNIDSCFNFFPPRSLEMNKNDDDLELSFFLPHIKSLDSNVVTLDSLPKANYYVLVIWNDFMIKPSRKLIEEIREYSQKYSDKNMHVLYINNHNQTLWRLSSEEDKKQIKDEISKSKK